MFVVNKNIPFTKYGQLDTGISKKNDSLRQVTPDIFEEMFH